MIWKITTERKSAIIKRKKNDKMNAANNKRGFEKWRSNGDDCDSSERAEASNWPSIYRFSPIIKNNNNNNNQKNNKKKYCDSKNKRKEK